MSNGEAFTSHGGLVDMFNAVIEAAVPQMFALGIRVVELRAGQVVGTAPIAGNGNHFGSMYAGTLFGLSEMLGGALFAPSFDSERFYPVVKSMEIAYLRPALTDVRATASLDLETITRLRHEAEDRGRAEFGLEVVITDAQGQPVAKTSATYQIRSH
jgi:hypothetical protein